MCLCLSLIGRSFQHSRYSSTVIELCLLTLSQFSRRKPTQRKSATKTFFRYPNTRISANRGGGLTVIQMPPFLKENRDDGSMENVSITIITRSNIMSQQAGVVCVVGCCTWWWCLSWLHLSATFAPPRRSRVLVPGAYQTFPGSSSRTMKSTSPIFPHQFWTSK